MVYSKNVCRQRTTACSMLGRFNQRPSIKTTPAQCPAAATGFIKVILCAMQELPSRQASPNQRWVNAGPPSTTLNQRHTKIDLTSRVRRAPIFENIESRSPAKLETTTQTQFNTLVKRVPDNTIRQYNVGLTFGPCCRQRYIINPTVG